MVRTVTINEHKGFCFDVADTDSDSSSNSRELTVTSGFELLPWDNYVVDDEKQYEEMPQIENKLAKKKLGKEQRKEERLQKKLNASRKKQAKKSEELKDDKEKGSYLIEMDQNPFQLQLEIKKVYSKIGQQIPKKSEDSRLYQYHSIGVYWSDVKHVLPEEWIDDNNIAFIYELLEQNFLNEEVNKFSYQISLLTPAVVQLFLHIPDTSQLESILPTNELKKLKFIFLPINFIDNYEEVDLEAANVGDHWALCLLDLLNNNLYVYDSMAEDEEIKDNKLLQELVKRISLCKSIVPSSAQLNPILMQCDQQTNSNDCGVYTIMMTIVLLKRLLYDKTINFDLRQIKFNALKGRLHILELVYVLFKKANHEPE